MSVSERDERRASVIGSLAILFEDYLDNQIDDIIAEVKSELQRQRQKKPKLVDAAVEVC